MKRFLIVQAAISVLVACGAYGANAILGVGWFGLPQPYGYVVEGESAFFNIHRSGDTNSAVSVDYATGSGTAQEGVDFVGRSGTILFAAGEVFQRITIETIDNGRVDGEREFHLVLGNPSEGAEIVPNSWRTNLTIKDNVTPVVWDPSFAPEASAYQWNVSQPMAIQPDGKLIITVPKLVRLNVDGSLDQDFQPAIRWHGSELPAAVALDSQGRVLIAGAFDAVGGLPRPGLARLNTNGTVDATFTPELFGLDSLSLQAVVDIAVQSDDRPIVKAWGDRHFTNFTFLRLNVDGSIDEDFHAPPAVADQARQIALQSTGKLLVVIEAADAADSHLLLRLDSNGGIDPSFHTPRFFSVEGPSILAVAVDSDDRIVIGGRFTDVDGYTRVGIARLNPDGTVDAEFQPHPGLQHNDRAGTVHGVGVDARHRILVTGDFEKANAQAATNGIVRFNRDGSVDGTFAIKSPPLDAQWVPGHLITFDIRASRIQPDGNILVSGVLWYDSFGNEQRVPFLARLYGEPVTNSVEFTKAELIAAENSGPVVITARRLGDVSGHATVRYATRGDTASADRDYIETSGWLSFAPLEREKSFSLTLVNNGAPEVDETIWLSLSEAVGVQMIGLPKARLRIVDDDPPDDWFGFTEVIWNRGIPSLRIFGWSGSSFHVQASSPNLSVWQTVGTVSIPDDSLEAIFTDRTADGVNSRFYRLRAGGTLRRERAPP